MLQVQPCGEKRGRKRKHSGPMDEIALDELAHHAATNSKYGKDTLHNITDVRFWILLDVVSRSRAPLQHVHNLLQDTEAP